MIKRKKDGHPVLSVRNLRVSFDLENNKINALKGISFDIFPAEIVALVGESGSGKSVTCYSILKLLPHYANIEGEIVLNGNYKYGNLLTISEEKIQKIRGSEISMIFQEPSAVLNPLMKVGDQIVEAIKYHQNVSDDEAEKMAIQAMRRARIPEAERRFNQYPHELSGGLKQRVVIAIGIANNPILLLADEPTTALDVTVSAQILKLFKKLKDESGISLLLITHDLGVVAEIADRVLVIYKGEIVESGNVFKIFDNPTHPYTKKLLSSRPRISTIL